MSSSLDAERKRTLEFLAWCESVRKEAGLHAGVKLGCSDGIAEDTLILLEMKESMTVEEWKEFLKGEKTCLE